MFARDPPPRISRNPGRGGTRKSSCRGTVRTCRLSARRVLRDASGHNLHAHGMVSGGAGEPLTRTEVAAIVALAVSLAATPAAAAAAARLGVVDRPGPLKPQSRPVPYLGGIGVLAGLTVAAALSRPLLVIPLVAATALGTADDVADLQPWIRFTGQIGIGIVVAALVPTRPRQTRRLRARHPGDGAAHKRHEPHRRARRPGSRSCGGGRRGLRPPSSRRPAAVRRRFALSAAGFLVLQPPSGKGLPGRRGRIPDRHLPCIALACGVGARGPAPGEPGQPPVVAIPAAEVTSSRRSAGGEADPCRGGRPRPPRTTGWWRRAGAPAGAAAAYVAAGLALGTTAVVASKSKSVSGPAATVGAIAATMLGVGRRAGCSLRARASRGITGNRSKINEPGRTCRRPTWATRSARLLLDAFDSNWIAPLGPARRRLRAGAGRARRRRARGRPLERHRRPAPGPHAAGRRPGRRGPRPDASPSSATANAVTLRRRRAGLRRLATSTMDHRPRPRWPTSSRTRARRRAACRLR